MSEFNSNVTKGLLDGALNVFDKNGGDRDLLDVIKVPGAFDIPLFAKKMATSGCYQAVVCVGAVIKGETPHFDYISAAMTQGIKEIMLSSRVPVTFGVLTTGSVEQALDRAGAKLGNKGWEAALSAIEMVQALKALQERLQETE